MHTWQKYSLKLSIIWKYYIVDLTRQKTKMMWKEMKTIFAIIAHWSYELLDQ